MMSHVNISKRTFSFALALLVIISGTNINARTQYGSGHGRNGQGALATQALAHCVAAHRVGKILLAINNNGTFGNGFSIGSSGDCFSNLSVPSCEYPKGSRVEYLYAGAFWIGAVVGRDTLVSVGADGWSFNRELYPDVSPFGDMIKRSIVDPSKPEYEGAVSEEDFICTYTDTFTTGLSSIEGRHIPLHIEVNQNSYAWSYAYAEDFILFDYRITNIGLHTLKSVYMGIYVDGDVCFDCDNTGGYSDDITGFLQTIPVTFSNCEYVDTVNVAWLADGDGDLGIQNPAPDVTATRIVRTPAESLDVSFNWWISSGSNAVDFGPRERSEVGRLKEEFRDFGTGGLGTPEGDENKYYIMRNREFDYDQARVASIQPNDTLWLYPNQDFVGEWARGLDTRYLLSFGPFDIEPGQKLPLSIAYLGGEDLHSVHGNIDNLPDNPEAFYANLNFDDLGHNSTWAGWIYDNPGVDTDGDGYAGKFRVCVLESILDSNVVGGGYTPVITDTQWYEGDGVPDFRGASPPPAPVFWLKPEKNSIRIRFNGFLSETTKDVFSGIKDFEGYRIYIGRDDRTTSFSTVTSYDVEDYNKWVWDSARNLWDLKDAPFTPEQLRCLYGDSCNDIDFNPERYTRLRPYTHPLFPDSLFFFQPQDFNVSELGQPGKLRKLYPDQPFPSTIIPEDALPEELTEDGYFKYFEYEYVIENLLPTVPYWINVTAFDFGSPQSGLPSLETSVTVGAKHAYPMITDDETADKDKKVTVWPNPYRIDADYRKLGFEGRTDIDRPNDRVRRIQFGNLPAKCTIRIFTIDGDLVREIEHDIPKSDPNSSHDSWNLITRNTQLVVSGLYYWTVESEDRETQIGKIVIIM